jgi:hypothetical protein
MDATMGACFVDSPCLARASVAVRNLPQKKGASVHRNNLVFLGWIDFNVDEFYEGPGLRKVAENLGY